MQFHSLNIQDEAAITGLAAKFDRLDVLVNCICAVKKQFEEGFEKVLTST